MLKTPLPTVTQTHATNPAAKAAPWWCWFAPRPFDWVATFLYGCVLVLFTVRQTVAAGGATPWLPVLGMAVVMAALLVLDRWEWWRYQTTAPQRVAVWLFVLRVMLIESVVQIERFGLSVFLYTLVPFSAAMTFGSRTGWLASALVWATFVAKLVWFKPLWYQSPELINNAIIFSMALIFMQAMARLVALERAERAHSDALLANLEHSHAQLQEYAADVARLATTTERNRIARDIHDSLGHYLTVINVQLEKALAFQSKDVAQAQQAMRDSKRLAHDALEDVRRSVGMLRTNETRFVLGEALHNLIAPLQNNQTSYVLEIHGNELLCSPPVLLALFRGAQEGLTNVQRHAQATQVRVRLDVAANEATLEIADNGIGFAATNKAPAGYGLRGLQERIELLGGTIDVCGSHGGTMLTIRIPCRTPSNQEKSA